MSTKGYTSKYRFSDIRTESPAMISCIKKAERIARIDKTTLIMGESGTGKELMAQSLHSASGRRNYPFVSINCAAIAPSLLESELFGYAEGAFTGSKKGGDFTAAITDSAVYETDEPDRLRQILSETYSQKENRMILFILSLVADGVKNRREIGNKLAGAGEECTGYRLKKILENLRSLGVISFSRGPEGIHLEKSGQNLIKTHEIS
ncbi:transcriptional regulator [[Clostridium] symbiosum]|nr:sigma 54-interacting transcriptional regulator [[Clostridium] symbiosum]SUY63479.1 transcriptional regulator [[Clostridium] symbiosum]